MQGMVDGGGGNGGGVISSNRLGPSIKPCQIPLFPAYTLYPHSTQIALIQIATTEYFTCC